MDKKRWALYKKQMKKCGFDSGFGYYYNIQQQKNHTATVSLAYITDPEGMIAEDSRILADEKFMQKEAERHARYDYSYIKRNRKTYDELFIPKAKEGVEKGEHNAESYLQHCLDECSHYDDGTYLEWKIQQRYEEHKASLKRNIEEAKNIPTRGTQIEEARKLFKQIESAQPTAELLKDIGGKLIFDIPERSYNNCYARFVF